MYVSENLKKVGFNKVFSKKTLSKKFSMKNDFDLPINRLSIQVNIPKDQKYIR